MAGEPLPALRNLGWFSHFSSSSSKEEYMAWKCSLFSALMALWAFIKSACAFKALPISERCSTRAFCCIVIEDWIGSKEAFKRALISSIEAMSTVFWM